MNIEREKVTNCLFSEEMSFEEKGLEIYNYQKRYNKVYRSFLEIIGRLNISPGAIEEIPFCPVSLFKSNTIKSGNWEAQQIFLSSGTTAMERSNHSVRDIPFYHENARHIWNQDFGALREYDFISLLPNYHDNPSSSLLSMVSHFMKNSFYGEEKYFLNDLGALHTYLEESKKSRQKTVLIGVSFALLSYLDLYSHVDMSHLIVIETGGMKRYREELTRSALQKRLSQGFQNATLCSEYGMTECFSQIYAIRGDQFRLNDRMRILISDPSDPFYLLPMGRTGRVNIIDLANIDTLSFFATDDIGKISDDEHIEILGRISNSDLRGCNYLI